ncbi:nucleotidyltransferase [Sulfuracidifex tepidarius]|uniref:Nucleotidyltransferase n=1 Tax=Sulfuracidifex tepidarius TaxID=1294262 RepID=A0A510DWG3_9CREN|nr:nucleotidyltransferase [Sulfuracidifex tepidarius]BBG24561.1 hypothetical protein IC006_1886 [Sulfuracidifex tepidarius]BBG27349.1 hypothetical protein IC007_1894 [Sulfuracidifex tepidarius]
MIQLAQVGDVLKELSSLTDFVIIGDTVLDVTLGRKNVESDIDVFLTSISVFTDEDVIDDFSQRHGWDLGKTPIDTPRFLVPIADDQLQIDLYENIQDFFVPPIVIESSTEKKIGDFSAKIILLEDYILLKANAFREEDERELKEIVKMVGERKIVINKEILLEHVEHFEENSKSIKERLNSIGIKF